MARFRPILVALLSLIVSRAALAQDKSTYYTVQHPTEFKINWKAFYDRADEMTAAVRRELPHTLDVAYGEHRKQRLDLYLPAQKPAAAPVLIFLHGGGFREGDRAHYGYVARPFAARGIVTVVASYRLTPDGFTYPAQVEDSRRLVAWVHRHIREHGGDPNRIYVSGHSAGAILAASVAMKTDWTATLQLPKDVIKGAIPVSATYDLRTLSSVNNYVPDATQRAEASPLLNVETPPPTIVAVGSPEPYVEGSKALVDRIQERGARAQLIVLDGLDHAQTVATLGESGNPLVTAMLEMIAGGWKSSSPSAAVIVPPR